MKTYPIVKQTATHADVLAAIGAADLLRHMDPWIVEFEDRFEVRLARNLRRSDLDLVDPGFSYLLRPGNAAPDLPPERITQLRGALNEGAGETADASAGRMYTILSRMKAYAGPNKIALQFASLPRGEWTERIWNCLHGDGRFSRSSALVQLFNPQSARGYALLKPNGTNRRDKTKDSWGEPFLEWLRYRGYFEGSAGWFTAGDLRLYCPIPGNIPFDEFAGATAALRALRLGGSAVKMDCRVVLGLTRALIEVGGSARRPVESIRGVCLAHYKDMGQAHTVMAIRQLALPDWFDLRDGGPEADDWVRALDEHETALQRLNDTHSDELAILKQYRRTFQARREESTAEFVTFLGDYAQLLFRRRAEDNWVLPQFTTAGVSSILNGNASLRGALQNPGLRAVSAAIRSATFGAQAARRREKASSREIRYGLLLDIRRAHSVSRVSFLQQVAAFIAAFNTETERRRMAGIPARRIREAEWSAFQSQVESLPSEISAGALLTGLSACLPAVAVFSQPGAETPETITA